LKDSDIIFNYLKNILMNYAQNMVVVISEPNHFYLNTHHIMKNKKPMYFASAKVNKNYVSFHLMPVYVFPELLDNISVELTKRMQGKSCFNFKVFDEALFNELTALTRAGYHKFEQANYL
jgi:hypothetical protein